MKTSTFYSSAFTSTMAALIVACGGGGGDASDARPLMNDAGACLAESVQQANAYITVAGSGYCRRWIVDGDEVDGASYPDFLIGDDA